MSRCHGRLLVLPRSVLALLLIGSLGAQGPQKRERWAHAHLESLRADLLSEIRDRGPETWLPIARELCADDGGIPFRPVVRALAIARGVTADPSFVYRAMLSAYPLPEVVDPQGDNDLCQRLNLTLFLPYTIEDPGTVKIVVRALDAAGDEVWRGAIERQTGLGDLRAARPTAVIPGAELDDGTYEIVVNAWIDGEAPRATDRVLTHRFHVLRGYQKRAQAAMAAAAERAAEATPLHSAILTGLSIAVSRSYTGEPFAGRSAAVTDLLRLEQALASLREGGDPLRDLNGVVTVGLPVGEDGEFAEVALRLSGARGEEKPLVLFLSGAPVYDARGRRPSSPRYRRPQWLADQVIGSGFDDGEQFHVAVMESPGRLRDTMAALDDLLSVLGEIWPVAHGKVLLVAERESAVVSSLGLARFGARLSGLALVCGGALPRQALARTKSLAVLGIAAHGHGSRGGLERTRDLIAGKYGAVDFDGSFELVDGDELPWTFALPLSLPRIEQFAASCLRD